MKGEGSESYQDIIRSLIQPSHSPFQWQNANQGQVNPFEQQAQNSYHLLQSAQSSNATTTAINDAHFEHQRQAASPSLMSNPQLTHSTSPAPQSDRAAQLRAQLLAQRQTPDLTRSRDNSAARASINHMPGPEGAASHNTPHGSNIGPKSNPAVPTASTHAMEVDVDALIAEHRDNSSANDSGTVDKRNAATSATTVRTKPRMSSSHAMNTQAGQDFKKGQGSQHSQPGDEPAVCTESAHVNRHHANSAGIPMTRPSVSGTMSPNPHERAATAHNEKLEDGHRQSLRDEHGGKKSQGSQGHSPEHRVQERKTAAPQEEAEQHITNGITKLVDLDITMLPSEVVNWLDNTGFWNETFRTRELERYSRRKALQRQMMELDQETQEDRTRLTRAQSLMPTNDSASIIPKTIMAPPAAPPKTDLTRVVTALSTRAAEEVDKNRSPKVAQSGIASSTVKRSRPDDNRPDEPKEKAIKAEFRRDSKGDYVRRTPPRREPASLESRITHENVTERGRPARRPSPPPRGFRDAHRDGYESYKPPTSGDRRNSDRGRVDDYHGRNHDPGFRSSLYDERERERERDRPNYGRLAFDDDDRTMPPPKTKKPYTGIPTVQCRYWKEGKCFKGDHCTFIHG